MNPMHRDFLHDNWPWLGVGAIGVVIVIAGVLFLLLGG